MDEYQSPDAIVTSLRPDIPLTCFRPQTLHTAARWFTSNFSGKVLYAVKVNPAPYVLAGLGAAGITDFDAASIHEVKLIHEQCQKNGVSGAFTAFMHPVKSRSAIEQAYFDFGVRDFAFDSLGELEKIIACTGNSQDLSLILRLAVPNTASELPLAGKFGVMPDKAADMLRAARRVSRRLGISFHVGSQTMDPEAYRTAISMVGDIIRAAPRTKVDVIDVGGGFPSVYPGMTPPPLIDYMAAIKKGLDNLPHPERYEFWCEPGRALVAESASIVVKVDLRKGDVLYINDGTFGSLFDAGPALGFRFPVRLIRPSGPASGTLKPFRFFGPTCTCEDYMPGPFLLPSDVREGDYIEIGQLGAYGNTMRTGFNGFSDHDIVSVQSPPLMTLYKEAALAAEMCVA